MRVRWRHQRATRYADEVTATSSARPIGTAQPTPETPAKLAKPTKQSEAPKAIPAQSLRASMTFGVPEIALPCQGTFSSTGARQAAYY